jgi:hypothetical protein
MSGGPTQNTSQDLKSKTNSNTISNPWAASIPGLQDILSQAHGLAGVPGSAAAAAQQYSPQLGGLIGNLFGGAGLGGFGGQLNSAYNTASSALNPIANGSQIGQSNPYTQSMLDTLANSVQNQVGDLWGRAGRSFSPGHAQALARGLGQAEAPVLFNQYNTDAQRQMEAISQLLGAGYGTSSALDAGALNKVNAQMQAPSALDALNKLGMLPASNLADLSNSLYVPIAGLGGTQNTTSKTKGTQTGQTSTSGGGLQTGIGAALGLLGLFA